MAINTTDTVRALAVEVPGAIRIFERLGIDYCCGGEHSLSDACRVANVPVKEVVGLLEETVRSVPARDELRDWQAQSLGSLERHIVDKHHVFTRQELVRLEELLTKVCSVHGQNHPELLGLKTLFQNLSQELGPHLLKEEQVLFPYITVMEDKVEHEQTIPPPFFGTVRNPVRRMMMEHETAGHILREMRVAANNYTVPQDGCSSYQALYDGLKVLEMDLHQHIHLENNILFPRAVEMEGATYEEGSSMPGNDAGKR